MLYLLIVSFNLFMKLAVTISAFISIYSIYVIIVAVLVVVVVLNDYQCVTIKGLRPLYLLSFNK